MLSWTLDPDVDFLNHGSFGACPLVVQEAQARLRAQLERQPVRFFLRDLEPLLDEARARLGRFVGADPDDLAFVRNATGAVNTVARSLELQAGDELLTTDHAYNACRNALEAAAARAGARLVVAELPFPLDDGAACVAAIERLVTPRTRLALVDHVTSPTGLVLPIREIIGRLGERGVDVLVDGAHAPGMLPLDVDALGAAYYTGNCHKWLCAPKGAAFLHVRRDRQAGVRPLSISHGATRQRPERSRFRNEFDWTGTDDPSPALSVPAALDALGGALPGGWPELEERNRSLALEARRTLTVALGVALPCPDEMIGALAAVALPRAAILDEKPTNPWTSPLQDRLLERFRIEVPIVPWRSGALVRISAQLYNRPEQYRRLAAALVELLRI